MSTEAMKLAASVLKGSQEYKRGHTTFVEAVEELEEALAQPQPEPVAWMTQARNFVHPMEFTEEEAKSYGWKAVYTSPPAQQEPVEYWTVANGWVSDQAEVPAAVWVEPDFWEHCNRVNCGTAYRLPAPGRQPLYTQPPAQPQQEPVACQYAKDVAMLEYRCVGRCQYDTSSPAKEFVCSTGLCHYRKPLAAREIELIDGMIEVQLDHAARCDNIANRVMAEKQKGWDMERVELLRKLKELLT